MTRKRFIKLQMAKGCSRNAAGVLAAAVRAHGMTYAAASAQDWPRGVTVSLVGRLTPALEGVAAFIRRFGEAITAASAAFQNVMFGGGGDDIDSDA